MAEVLVAMSGGVDSAVAALELVEQGHRVTGVHLELSHVPAAEQVPGQGCCTIDDAQDARVVAARLGIDFYVWNFRELFAAEVQDPFARAYAEGRTPHPCVVCNEKVKYAALLDRALALGFDAIATGHHARLVTENADGVRHAVTEPVALEDDPAPVLLVRGADARKDQTAVLYAATQRQLRHTLLPIGHLTKDAVRARARDAGLRVFDKPDSYDICFIPDGDTAGYLGRHLPVVAGDIVEQDGTVAGRHDGIWHVTIGQRRGLGLGDHRRRFVLAVDAASNRVVIGDRDDLRVERILAARATWTGPTDPRDGRPVRLQVRSHGATVPAVLRRPDRGAADVADDRVEAVLVEPLHGVAPGQSIIVYDDADEVCLGGAVITSTDSIERALR